MKTPYLMICAILVVLATASVGLADVSAGLVAYYPFNGNANDESGNGNHGTVHGAAVLTDDRFGNSDSAYNFDGVDDYISLGDPPALQIISDLTITCWIYNEYDGNKIDHIVGRRAAGCGLVGYQIGRNSGNGFSFTAGGYREIHSGITIPDDQWFFIAVVFNDVANTVDFYANDQKSLGVGASDLGNPANADIQIGQANDCSSSTIFDGIIDDVRFYDRALSSSEIQEIQDMTVVCPSGVTGLDVGGKLYDVTFNDGYFTDFWPDGSSFPPFWGDRTQSEAAAIALAEALSTVPPTTHLTTASGGGGTWQFFAIPFDGFYWPDPETLVPVYWIVEYQPVPSGNWQVAIDMPWDSYYLWAVFTNTPAGEDVEVSAPEAGTTITFAHVDVTGDTTVTTTQGGPPPPTGFRLMPLKTYYAIDSTAEFSGTIEIAIEYDDAGLSAGQEAALKLRHYDEASTTWEDITTSQDTVNNIIYGTTDHLSFFAITMGRLVEIDIKPGSYPNAINLASQGVIPVAIFSSSDFDATTVDPETIELSGAGVAVRGKGNKYMAHEEDVNGDGLTDLVCKVETENFDPGAFQYGFADLTGQTYDGVYRMDADEIIIVPPKK